MGNTLGTTNASVIAQKALEALVAQLPLLRLVASDYSKEGARKGESVIVHAITSKAAEDFAAATGYAPIDQVQVDIPVTINKHKHHTYKIGVDEASSSRVSLIERFANNAAYSIGAALVGDLCALVKAAAFANKTTKALGAGLDGFDRKTAVAVGTALSKRKVGQFGRFLMLNADYYGSLASDNTMLTLMLQAGASAAQSGVLPKVHGMQPMEFVDLPENGENLVGFAGVPTALAIATRIPDDPGDGMSGCKISVVTDEDSGLSLQVREWYEATLAQYRRTYTLMYGVAVGQTDGLQRIVSA
jgi:hypothetical protein